MFQRPLFPFFFQPTRMLTVDSPWAYASSIKTWDVSAPLSTDVPLTLKPWITTALKVLKWDVDDELNFRAMLFFIHLAADDTFSTLCAYLSWGKRCDLNTVNILKEGYRLDEGTPRSLGRGNRRSQAEVKERWRIRKTGIKKENVSGGGRENNGQGQWVYRVKGLHGDESSGIYGERTESYWGADAAQERILGELKAGSRGVEPSLQAGPHALTVMPVESLPTLTWTGISVLSSDGSDTVPDIRG